ncbi:kynureninase [Ophiostoma piceae UAMH 11346]|uniref:Kynureninase n=1 Tax=Ophiostoma piceae (strain UAMH 11346) TaxID=1262450 RepID=S3C182_OPHP1|nr:kynureninase [Ophiostoma piceae UAMH 11346]
MSFNETLAVLRAGQKPQFPGNANSLDYARSMDGQDPLRHLRGEYIIPSKAMIKKRKLEGVAPKDASQNDPAIYFCGNSLGLQPKATRRFVEAQLETWGSIGVQGHFVSLEDSPLSAWQDMVATCSAQVAKIVGVASPSEVVTMNTLTANLHLMMASFYKPTATRHKIIAEWKPFPSDSYAIASQLELHGLDVASSLVELQPDANMYISTELVLKTIDEHADSTALLLLPGIQYYSGQLFDIKTITAHARSKGIVVGWDLAHAIGNVELQLHDWDIDFAVWCTYKYVNSGPGGIAGAFVHDKHGAVTQDDSGRLRFHPRLSGWYGCDVSVRFNMSKEFQPTPGAQGFQVSNPSAMDLASLGGSLSVFDKTTVRELRDKSLVLTAYAEHLLNSIIAASADDVQPFKIITPANPMERGAQLSVWLKAGTMPAVGEALDKAGIILDQRKPDVIRIAPVPMYNTFEEVFTVIDVLRRAVV